MNPIFLKFGFLEIRYYGLMYVIAFILGYFIMKYEAKKRNINLALIEDYVFFAIVSGLIGGRAYYVMLNLDTYMQDPREIIAVWHGGMAIHGGIIGGIIGTYIFSKIKKIDLWVLGDMAAAPFILGQAIGRIGNLMNGDAHGVPTFTPINVMVNNTFTTWWAEYLGGLHKDLTEIVPWGIIFPAGTPAGDEFPNLPTHPVMVYEMILNFVAFLSIWFIFRKKKLPTGTLFLIYLVEYSIIRSVVTIFRADDLMFWGTIRSPHLLSIIIITGAVITFFYLKKKEKKS